MARMVSWLLLQAAASIAARPHLPPPPRQIHLSLGSQPSEMRVTWSTERFSPETKVRYGESELTQTATGSIRKFVDGGTAHHTQYIHSVLLTGLKPGTVYFYQCGGPGNWSQTFHFRTLQEGGDWSPRFVMYGDLGVVNGVSIPYLVKDVQSHVYDVLLHIGDFAYDLDWYQAYMGDWFMDDMQPVAAYVPYMTCPGNHEYAYNFSNYRNRFVMPGDEMGEKLFFSFNVGPVHVVSYSTEYYYFPKFGTTQAARQHAWVEQDLREANKPENRAQRPWIVTMGHRPMYCSNSDGDDCTNRNSQIRSGNDFAPGLEPLWYKYGVDLALEAHEHSYERLWPVYNRTVMNGTLEHPYTNPRAPVHVITGSAGCREDTDGFISDPAPWSAFRDSDYGYARMTVNRTHLYLEQIAVKEGSKVIDDVTIIKDKHGSYE